MLLPVADYLPGAILPPHLSPFVEANEGDYVPPEKQRLIKMKLGLPVEETVTTSNGKETEKSSASSDKENKASKKGEAKKTNPQVTEKKDAKGKKEVVKEKKKEIEEENSDDEDINDMKVDLDSPEEDEDEQEEESDYNSEEEKIVVNKEVCSRSFYELFFNEFFYILKHFS